MTKSPQQQNEYQTTSPQKTSGGSSHSPESPLLEKRTYPWIRYLVVVVIILLTGWFLLQVLLYSGRGIDETRIIILGLLALSLFCVCFVVIIKEIRHMRQMNRKIQSEKCKEDRPE